MPNRFVPTEAGLDIAGTHVVDSKTSRSILLNGLKTVSYWNEFANGYTGAEAQGAPEFDILMKSYNEKHNENVKIDPNIPGDFKIDITDTLYIPHDSTYNGVARYWIASPAPDNSIGIWTTGIGTIYYTGNVDSMTGLRPVVCLPSSVTGTVGENIQIDGI